MKIIKEFSFLVGLIAVLMMVSCGENKKENPYDSPKNGTIHISVDESFEPVIIEQIKVYQSSFPDAHIIASYKSEADCFRDLQNDSTRMIIVAKGLTEKEREAYKEKIRFKPQFGILAFDAVCVIVNEAATDTVFSMEKIKKILTDSTSGKQVVVDGNNATSTVRYLLDSVVRGNTFSSNVRAAKGSREVIEYVSNNKNAVGFVGSSWVGNEDDPEQVANFKKIRMALVQCKSCENNIFAKPSQATISYGQYPLVRPLYYIVKENTTGLGTGFTNFMSLERGQLIFKRSYLVPAKMYFGVRTSLIDNK